MEPPVTFMVRAHALIITCVADGRWTVSMDGEPASGTYGTQVEAWESGVRTADARDRPAHA
jgi:hypothetical protein